MAISFNKKPVADQTPAAPATPAIPPTAPAQPPKPSWLLSGAERKAVMAQAEAQQEMQKSMQGTMWQWPWRLKMGEQGQATFLDGELDNEGLLSGQSFWMHTKRLNNRWENFVCVAQFGQEPCPICELAEKPAFVTVFTVIDHRPYTIQNGPKAGQVVQNQRKLFRAKANDLAVLQFQATALGGLAGVRFNIARIGSDEKKTSSVGNQFTAVAAKVPLASLAQQYAEHGVPADYETEIPVLSAAQLIQLGAGKAPFGPGYPQGGATFNVQAMADQI
jgi:hypothetical protein